MSTGILDLLERLLTNAQHPDISDVRQYEPAGIVITYQSGAKAFIWPTTERAQPADWPAEMPEYKFRAMHALRLVIDLLEVAKPDGVQWRTVSVSDVALSPCGIEIRAGQESTVLRVTSGGAPGPDTDPATFADYRIPDAARLISPPAAVG